MVDTKAYGTGGELAYTLHSVTSADGRSVSNSYDDNGDGRAATDIVRHKGLVDLCELRAHRAVLRGAGSYDRIQTIATISNANGSTTETHRSNERPILPGDLYMQAEQHAQELRDWLGLGAGPITDVVSILDFRV